jgi:Flp pilus assembly protein TadD
VSVNTRNFRDETFHAVAHPKQNSRFYLAVVFSTLLFPLVAIGLLLGSITLIVPLFAFLIWMSTRTFFAVLIGNTIRVSEINYPRIQKIVDELKVALDFEKPIHVFVFENSSFNAGLNILFFRRAIFLNSELLESGVSDSEMRWIIGRFVGFLRARRQAGFLGWVIRAAQHLLVFNLFLLPYDRALVHTGDRMAIAAIGGDITSAISATQKLFVGRQLGYSINPEGIIEQQRDIKGSVFAFLARLASGYPHLVSRYVDMIAFAKVFYPAQYAAFQSANPGLPDDIEDLAARHHGAPQFDSNGRPYTTARPAGWAFAVGTLVITVGLGFLLSAGPVNSTVAAFGNKAVAEHGADDESQVPAQADAVRSSSDLAPTATKSGANAATAGQAGDELMNRASNCTNALDCLNIILEATSAPNEAALSVVENRIVQMNRLRTGDAEAARTLNDSGLEKLRGQDYAGAIDLLIRASEQNPNDAVIRSNLGVAYLGAGNFKEAQDALVASLQINPRRASAWQLLGEALAQNRQLDAGVSALIAARHYADDKAASLRDYDQRATTDDLPEILREAYQRAARSLRDSP